VKEPRRLLQSEDASPVLRDALRALDHWCNPDESRGFIARRNFIFRYLAIKIFRNGIETAIEKALLDVTENDTESPPREDVRNSVPHGSRTNHSHALNCHDCLAESLRKQIEGNWKV